MDGDYRKASILVELSNLARVAALNTFLPLAAVLLGEHLILRYRHHRQSSLERLTVRLSASGKTDLVMAATTWVPVGLIYLVFRLITLPGLTLTAVVIIDGRTSWSGLFGNLMPTNTLLALAIWYLAWDFGHYVAHYLLHRIPALWEIHKLHHAATEFNIVTGNRVSFAERAFNQLVSLSVTTIVLGVPGPGFYLAVKAIKRLVNMLQHSDLPWDYGPLGKLIASPRYHRMHHSSAPVDYDSNFGDLFSFWDRLFGTTSRRYRESGSGAADEAILGLGDASANAHYNRWWTALYEHTVFHYAATIVKSRRAWKQRFGTGLKA